MDSTSIHENVVRMTQMLQNLSGCLEKANKHVLAKKIDMDVLLHSRLIVDQFPLIKQIQIACDVAVRYAARLSTKEIPSFPDNEKTFSEIQKRIADSVAHLETYKENDFKNFESIKAVFPWMPGKYLTGRDFAIQFAVPNFYFHVTTAYSIMRSNGVELGKADYIGNLPFKS